MDRNFILAGSFAAVVHGALFLFPRGVVPPRGIALKDVIDLVPYRFELQKDSEPDPDVDVVSASSNGAADLTKRQVDAPQSGKSDWIVPVEYNPPAIRPGVTYTPGRIGEPGGIGVGDVGSSPLSITSLDHTPRARLQVAPEYPAEARHDASGGTVTVEFVVDESGHVYNAHVIESTDRVFNDAAVRAVGKWRFEPGTVHGRVVRFRMAVPVVFHLNS